MSVIDWLPVTVGLSLYGVVHWAGFAWLRRLVKREAFPVQILVHDLETGNDVQRSTGRDVTAISALLSEWDCSDQPMRIHLRQHGHRTAFNAPDWYRAAELLKAISGGTWAGISALQIEVHQQSRSVQATS